MHYTNSQVTKNISNRTLYFFKFLQCMHVRITTVHLLFLPLTTLWNLSLIMNTHDFPLQQIKSFLLKLIYEFCVMKKYDGYNSSVIHFGFVQKFMDKAIILYYYLIVRRVANNIWFDFRRIIFDVCLRKSRYW